MQFIARIELKSLLSFDFWIRIIVLEMAKFGNLLGNNWYFLVACSNFHGGGKLLIRDKINLQK